MLLIEAVVGDAAPATLAGPLWKNPVVIAALIALFGVLAGQVVLIWQNYRSYTRADESARRRLLSSLRELRFFSDRAVNEVVRSDTHALGIYREGYERCYRDVLTRADAADVSAALSDAESAAAFAASRSAQHASEMDHWNFDLHYRVEAIQYANERIKEAQQKLGDNDPTAHLPIRANS